MRQVLQSSNNGHARIEHVPLPALRNTGILVRSRVSLISAGTERSALQLGHKNLLGMARERPDLVERVLQKLRRDGFWATLHTVRDQLDRDVPLGYSVCGNVTAVGAHVSRFQMGQLVACAGAGYASHAEINYVPDLLAAPVPTVVAPEQGAYATVGAIALQGIRNAEAKVGEVVVVIGLGLVGQLAVQLLSAAGCRVAGLDLSPQRVELALKGGAEAAFVTSAEAERAIWHFTRGRGADAVLITAATKSNEPVELAARLARDRGRVVMVGVTGMDLPRNAYYHKELSFVVSRSYGPGRYDPQYEEQGHDYPIGHVRWTENRNLEAFLDLVAAGRVRPELCTTHSFPIDQAEQAYELILSNSEPHLGVLLTYPEPANGAAHLESSRLELTPNRPRHAGTAKVSGRPTTAGPASLGISFIGAGSFARSVLLPALAKARKDLLRDKTSGANTQLRGVVTSSGISARSAGRKFGFQFCATSPDEVLADAATDAVFIATPHASHAGLVCRALAAGKTVFVEKPLAVTLDQLADVHTALAAEHTGLLVGFNRRFAPLAQKLKDHIAGHGPLLVHYRCNAGPLPGGHWLADPHQGGRLIGEACHFFDFFSFLTDAAPHSVQAFGLPPQHTGEHNGHAGAHANGQAGPALDENVQATVRYTDGSVCHLLYTSLGPGTLGKERIEVFADSRAAVLDDFRTLWLHRHGARAQRIRHRRADKGHQAQLLRFLQAIRSQIDMPIPAHSLLDTTRLTLAAVESLRSAEMVMFSS